MKRFFLLILLLSFSCLAYSQLPNQNTYLVSNIDSYSGYSGLWGYVAPDNREYAILGCDSGTSIVDVTDSANVHEIDYVPGVFSGWREMKTYSHYAYVVSEGTNSRLQIIDLQYLPDSVSLVSTWNYSGYTYTHAIQQDGPFLYLSGGNAAPNGGVQIVDVTIPTLPVRRGFNPARYVHDARVVNDTIWTCNILNRKVSIISASDKDNIHEIRNFNTIESAPHNCAKTKDGNFLYVTHESNDPGKLEVWNVSDLKNITFVRTWQPTGIFTSVIHNVEIVDTIAFVAHYTAGVRILNVSNPSNPVEIAWYDTRPQDNSNNYFGCWAVYKFPSGKIIASDISNGLFVIKTSVLTGVSYPHNQIPGKIELKQNYPNPFNPETKIRFEIPSNAGVKMHDVSLSVYDALGKQIATLLNEQKSPGSYEVKFDGSKFASGIYFYKLEVDGKLSDVKRMTLLK